MSLRATITMAGATPVYWCSVYPRVCREVERQGARAATIPRARLRALALSALERKRSNIDGAAAFACFAPRSARGAVVRAQVAFQSLYDYLDTLAEQPHPDPVSNSRRLHGALATALDPSLQAGSRDAWMDQEQEDGGYVRGTVERCQTALLALPGYPALRASTARLGDRIVDYQSFNVANDRGPQEALERWARETTPPDSGLRWWETAASAGSSLGLLALIAMAAQPQASAVEALAVEQAYFPWIGALHSLLDSLVDLVEDRQDGQASLIEHYGDAEEVASRLRLLARESRRQAAGLPDSARHLAVLAAMASLYLAEREAAGPHARPARRGVLGAVGPARAPAMLAVRARRLARPRRVLA